MLGTIGLIMELLGILLLAFYNLPTDYISKEGKFLQSVFLGDDHQDTIGEIARYRKYRIITLVGYSLLFLGFGLQIAQNFC
jgi:uncharacterized membrane protein